MRAHKKVEFLGFIKIGALNKLFNEQIQQVTSFIDKLLILVVHRLFWRNWRHIEAGISGYQNTSEKIEFFISAMDLEGALMVLTCQSVHNMVLSLLFMRICDREHVCQIFTTVGLHD